MKTGINTLQFTYLFARLLITSSHRTSQNCDCRSFICCSRYKNGPYITADATGNVYASCISNNSQIERITISESW